MTAGQPVVGRVDPVASLCVIGRYALRGSPEADLLAREVLARRDQLAQAAVARIFEQVDDYAQRSDLAFQEHVTEHCRRMIVAFSRSVLERREANSDDFPHTAEQAIDRVEIGISLADFLRALSIVQDMLWTTLLNEVTRRPECKDAALSLVENLMQVVQVATTTAAEAFVEAERFSVSGRSHLRQELMRDLLHGRLPHIAARVQMLSEVGISTTGTLVVAVASFPRTATGEDSGSVAALNRLRGALESPGHGLAVIRPAGPASATQPHTTAPEQPIVSRRLPLRHEVSEVVAVLPVEGSETHLLRRLRAALRAWGSDDARPVVGISAMHPGITGLVGAYDEACLARRSLQDQPGLRCVSEMSTLDYLVQTHDPTATRLVRPEIRSFVAEDLDAGGSYLETLREYVACDLNAKLAAQRLHLHANTVYYRLERITARTGCDVRRVESVIELLIAVSILTGQRGENPAQTIC